VKGKSIQANRKKKPEEGIIFQLRGRGYLSGYVKSLGLPEGKDHGGVL